MKFALIGEGAMGTLVANLVIAAGDEIGFAVSSSLESLESEDLAQWLRGNDVAVDFSASSAVLRNIGACALAGVPLVEGTTGWQEHEAEARRLIESHNGAMVYGANFSIGVNVFYRIVSQAASMMAGLDQYQAFMEEEHHARKRDAPSGTALKLKGLMSEHIKTEIPIASVRAGHIPGTHRVGFDSAADQITLTHTARSREGFAAGALWAARWIVGRKGVFEFTEVIDEMLKLRRQR